jgi:hypothetical protein
MMTISAKPIRVKALVLWSAHGVSAHVSFDGLLSGLISLTCVGVLAADHGVGA